MEGIYLNYKMEELGAMLRYQLSPLTIQHFQIFYSLAETLNFTQTARELKMTQPSISKHLAKLEDILGFTLFERTPQSVALTQKGRVCFQEWVNVLPLVERGYANMISQEPTYQNEIRIGLPINVDYKFFLAQFHEICQHRELKIHLVDEVVSGLRGLVEQGSIDIAFMPDVQKYNLDTQIFGWSYVEFACLNAVVNKKHPLATRETVVLTDIIDIPLIAFSKGENTAALAHIRDLYRPYGKNPVIVDYVTSNYQIAPALQNSNHLFIAGPHFPDYILEGCKIIPITDQRSGTIAVWDKRNEQEHIRSFVNLLRDYNQAYGLY